MNMKFSVSDWTAVFVGTLMRFSSQGSVPIFWSWAPADDRITISLEPIVSSCNWYTIHIYTYIYLGYRITSFCSMRFFLMPVDLSNLMPILCKTLEVSWGRPCEFALSHLSSIMGCLLLQHRLQIDQIVMKWSEVSARFLSGVAQK